MKQLWALLAEWWPQGLRAQAEPEGEWQWVRLSQYQLCYQIPTSWTPVCHTSARSLVITYFNPDRTLRFTAGKARGAAARFTPAQALTRMALQYGIVGARPIAVAYDGLRFLEITGTSRLDGQPHRYQALVTEHHGHLLLLYMSAPPDVFIAHQPDISRILHSMAYYGLG